jgi:hypothetical protein
MSKQAGTITLTGGISREENERTGGSGTGDLGDARREIGERRLRIDERGKSG